MSSEKPRPIPRLANVEAYARRYPQCDPEGMRTFLMVRHLEARLDHAMEAHLARHHLSFGRFMVLVQLIQSEGHSLPPAQLSTFCGVSRATMTGLLDTLEKSAFITREPDPDDGRSSIVRLSVTGRRFLEKMLPDHFTRLTRMTSVLTTAEQQELQRLTAKLAAAVGALEDP